MWLCLLKKVYFLELSTDVFTGEMVMSAVGFSNDVGGGGGVGWAEAESSCPRWSLVGGCVQLRCVTLFSCSFTFSQ